MKFDIVCLDYPEIGVIIQCLGLKPDRLRLTTKLTFFSVFFQVRIDEQFIYKLNYLVSDAITHYPHESLTQVRAGTEDTRAACF